MKYPSSLKESLCWYFIIPNFREEEVEVLSSDKHHISNSEPEPFEMGAVDEIYTTNSVLRRPELYCHNVMTR